jgi:hypothetical protein
LLELPIQTLHSILSRLVIETLNMVIENKPLF